MSVAQGWFRSQTGGKHPIFERDGPAISVERITLSQAASEYSNLELDLYPEIREKAGRTGDSPLLVFFEGRISSNGNCGWSAFSRLVLIPIDNCSIAPQSGTMWPYGSTYLIAHELTHLLGAVEPCAPNYHENSPSHVDDSNRDILYIGPDGRDWNNLVLDHGNDDYYNHGRDDCHDIARNQLLAHE